MLFRKLLVFKGSPGFSSSSSWPLTALEVISKLNCSLSMCHRLLKTIVTLDTKGMKSGYICQAVLQCFWNRMLRWGLVWSWPFVERQCLELGAGCSPGYPCNRAWWPIFVRQSETCFSLSFIKSMSWNRILLFVRLPNRNSVGSNWKQIIQTFISPACRCVSWRGALVVLLFASFINSRVLHNFYFCEPLSFTTARICSSWHHLPFSHFGDHCQHNTLICSAACRRKTGLKWSCCCMLSQQESSKHVGKFMFVFSGCKLAIADATTAPTSVLVRFHFPDLSQRSHQSKQGVKDCNNLPPFGSSPVCLLLKESDPVTAWEGMRPHVSLSCYLEIQSLLYSHH